MKRNELKQVIIDCLKRSRMWTELGYSEFGAMALNTAHDYIAIYRKLAK